MKTTVFPCTKIGMAALVLAAGALLAQRAGAEEVLGAEIEEGFDSALELFCDDEEEDEDCEDDDDEDEDADAAEDEGPPPARRKDALVQANALLAGSWTADGLMSNRADLWLQSPRLNLGLRGRLLDKRPDPLGSGAPEKEPLQALGAGFYHFPTGSRLLYGPLTEAGLAYRLSGVWSHGVPWVSTSAANVTSARQHKAADLRATVSASAAPKTYLYLASPRLSLGVLRYRAFARASAEEGEQPDLGGGLALEAAKTYVGVESFFTSKTLPERAAGGWFSEKHYLPERTLKLYAGSAVINHPYFALAADLAVSEVFAWGRDVYAAGAVRLGRKPFLLSATLEGSGERFVGSGGAAAGGGMRGAAKLEWLGKRSALLRLATTLRAPAWQGDFERTSSDIVFALPKPQKPWPLRLSRLALGFDRDARSLERIKDSFDITAGFELGAIRAAAVRAAVKTTFSAVAVAGPWYTVYPSPFDTHDQKGCKFSFETSAAFPRVQLKALLTCTQNAADGEADPPPEWKATLTGVLQSKPGRLTVKHVFSAGQWTTTVSWRLKIA